MNQYIATFYAHFGAIRFKRHCDKIQVEAKAMPVPRNLSSSCGTCVSYKSEIPLQPDESKDEIEQIVRVTETGYEQIYSAED